MAMALSSLAESLGMSIVTMSNWELLFGTELRPVHHIVVSRQQASKIQPE